ncbi:MAG: hypothetical protein ACE5K9_06350 [Candidatus Methylomirabilales bacterium]
MGYARERLREMGEVPLTLFVVRSNDQIKIVEFADEVPQPVDETIRETVRRLEGTAVVVVGEAWMKEYHAVEDKAVGETLEEVVAHQQSPDRTEILMVEGIHGEGSISWLMRISREGGRIVCGRAHRLEEGDTVFGGGLSDVLTR